MAQIALIVEDEPDMAVELAELVRSFGHDALHATTLTDALQRIEAGGFCYVLLDLQIKADAGSIRPRIECGMAVLRAVRQRYPARGPRGTHLLPVLAVSGHGREPRTMIDAFQDGVDDFILKPLGSENQDIAGKIRRCLELAGRGDHDACDTGPGDSPAVADDPPAFRYTPDYSEIRLDDQVFMFTGDLQRAALRYLHQAVRNNDPWCSGKAILRAAGSSDLNMRMVNLFGRHPGWGTVVLSNRRGRYRLRVS